MSANRRRTRRDFIGSFGEISVFLRALLHRGLGEAQQFRRLRFVAAFGCKRASHQLALYARQHGFVAGLELLEHDIEGPRKREVWRDGRLGPDGRWRRLNLTRRMRAGAIE